MSDHSCIAGTTTTTTHTTEEEDISISRAVGMQHQQQQHHQQLGTASTARRMVERRRMWNSYQHHAAAIAAIITVLSSISIVLANADNPIGDQAAFLPTEQQREHRKQDSRRRRVSHDVYNDYLERSRMHVEEGQPPHQLPTEDMRNKYRIDDTNLRDVMGNMENGGVIGTGNRNENEPLDSNTGLMPQLRIINGASAPETRYPYSASLQYNNQHFCGGSLVAPDIVITAAHCTSTPAKITLGRYDLDSPTDFDFEELDVLEKIIHPQYDKTVVENDLALLVLERESVHPVVKINAERVVPYDGEKLVVMGWGDIDPHDYGQETSDELRETDVWYVTNENCEKSQGYVKTEDGILFGSYEGSIRESMLCAHDRIGTTSDACQGDSGGALVKTGPDSTDDILVGLVSWGFGCADPNFPGVYSRISAYYDTFLKPMICQYSRSPPADLNCNGNMVSQPAVTPAPVATPDGLLTIFVDTDPFKPQDLGWELVSVPGGEVIASRPIGFYANKYRTTLSEEVIVAPENFYRLALFDKDEDGFRGEVTLAEGRRYVRAEALVYEPGFSSVSGSTVVHGFYVGDNPPRELTLDLTFDQNPDDLAWSITNVEDDLPLGFKWFDWYGKDFMSAQEKIPIYGGDRGRQKYVFTVLDLDGNGMCCSQGSGSFSLYLGDPSSENLIATGGQFTTDESVTFEVSAAGVVTLCESGPINVQPTDRPTGGPAVSGFYMDPATGICLANGPSKPAWISQVFGIFDQCCMSSWNKENCNAAKPLEVPFESLGASMEATPVSKPSAPVGIFSTTNNNEGQNGSGGILDEVPFTYTPVTGSFTCTKSGLACTIKCAQCGSIKRVASGMYMKSPDKSTIVYTAARGTEDFPEEPSRLILVESDMTASNIISCDEGCRCDSVNDNVLGCGLMTEPITVELQPATPYPAPLEDEVNDSTHRGPAILLMPTVLVVWIMFI